MNNQVEPKTENDKLRSVWRALTVLFAIVLLVKIFEWIRGGETFDEVLQPAVLLLLGLIYGFQLKGAARRALLAASAVLGVLMLVLLITKWF